MNDQRAGSVETGLSGSTTFGARLRALREAAGLTQEELAERASLTTHAVSALERGTRTRPYPHTVRSLASALGASERERAQLLAAVPRRQKSTAGDAVAGSLAGTPARALPVPATPLVGREREVTRLSDLLARPGCRLVTLTGTGGVGKTRLSVAVAVADEVADRFPDGVAFAALAPISDAALVVPVIARALGIGPLAGPDAEALVTDHLRPLRLLLVLDNFEHLIEAAAQVARLVAACPGDPGPGVEPGGASGPRGAGVPGPAPRAAAGPAADA